MLRMPLHLDSYGTKRFWLNYNFLIPAGSSPAVSLTQRWSYSNWASRLISCQRAHTCWGLIVSPCLTLIYRRRTDVIGDLVVVARWFVAFIPVLRFWFHSTPRRRVHGCEQECVVSIIILKLSTSLGSNQSRVRRAWHAQWTISAWLKTDQSGSSIFIIMSYISHVSAQKRGWKWFTLLDAGIFGRLLYCYKIGKHQIIPVICWHANPYFLL